MLLSFSLARLHRQIPPAACRVAVEVVGTLGLFLEILDEEWELKCVIDFLGSVEVYGVFLRSLMRLVLDFLILKNYWLKPHSVTACYFLRAVGLASDKI